MQEQPDIDQKSIPAAIFEILEQELQLSQEMLDLLDEEKIAMTKMDLKSLIALSKKKENQLVRIQQLDESLQEAARQIADAPNTKVVKLSALITLASGVETTMLKRYRDKLTYMREEIISRNVLNRRFAQDVQGYLNDAISMITRSVVKNPMYGTKGARKPSANEPSLISKEV